MRARLVKPEFFRDRKMGQLGPVVALVYQALWVSADDYGTARADPEQLKGDMFTWWDSVSCADIAQALQTLAHCKRVTRYTVGDETYARILNWDKHQKVHMPGKFRYPRTGTALTPPADPPPCADPAQSCADTASPFIHISNTPSTTTTPTTATAKLSLAGARSSTPTANGNAAEAAAQVLLPVVQATDRRDRRDHREGLAAKLVFAYWATRLGHRQAKADLVRLRRIRSRLREAGGDPHDLLYAVDGAVRDDWTMGRDAKTNGKRYDSIETIFRDRGKVEELAGLCPDWVAGTPHPKAAEWAAALDQTNGDLGADDGPLRPALQPVATGNPDGVYAG